MVDAVNAIQMCASIRCRNPHDKSRYRGKIKHKIWANARCLWINFVRILKFILNSGTNYAQIIQKQLYSPQFMLKICEITILIQTIGKIKPVYSKITTKKEFWKNDFL